MTTQASRHHSTNVQILSDLSRIDSLSPVARYNTSRHNSQLWNFRKAVDQALGDLIVYVLGVGIARFINKRQDGYRLNRVGLSSFAPTREVKQPDDSYNGKGCRR